MKEKEEVSLHMDNSICVVNLSFILKANFNY